MNKKSPIVYPGITRERLTMILEKIKNVQVVLLGDVCLDVYWKADMRLSELSRETPHYPLPVIEERMSPGGGGNVVANLSALAPAAVRVVSSIGTDWRGRELKRLLTDLHADTDGLTESEAFVTNTYIKPLRSGISDVIYEDPRLDFTNYRQINAAEENAVIDALEQAVKRGCDVLCVSDQMPFGIVTEKVRRKVIELAAQGLPVIADSRDRASQFTGVTLKPNEIEGARAVGIDVLQSGDINEYSSIAQKLACQNKGQVFMTVGANGSLVTEGESVWHIPAHKIDGPVDIVGAGDSSLSGFSLAVAASGANLQEAACIAGLCSEVTIQQLHTTGTAPAEKIFAWYDHCQEKANA